MLKSVFERIYDRNIEVNGCRFREEIDFLRHTDCSFVNAALGCKELRNSIKRILNRNLLMRALTISRHTVEESTLDNFRMIVRLRKLEPKSIELVREVRKEISSRLKSMYGNECEYYNIWLDLPEMPRFNESFLYLIRMTGNKYEYLSELFPAAQWALAFAEFKWIGHVFCPLGLQRKVAKIAQDVLKEFLDLEFNPSSIIMAKHH